MVKFPSIFPAVFGRKLKFAKPSLNAGILNVSAEMENTSLSKAMETSKTSVPKFDMRTPFSE